MSAHEFAVSPADGPIAVTGASGYIGSWIVQDCMEQGYEVRACVRDASNPAKTEHLLDLNALGMRGHAGVALIEADLFKPGSYDEAFKRWGCAAVIHAGATVGFNRELVSPKQEQFMTVACKENAHVRRIESVKRSGSAKRFVFTSSFCSGGAFCPRPAGYVVHRKRFGGVWRQH